MKDIFMVKISEIYNKFDAAPDFRDLTKNSNLQDRKVDNVAFLSTVKNKDFSKFKIDAQGDLYKRGSIKQVFRDIANVFTPSSTLKERNSQVASKIVELRGGLLKNGASKANFASYSKSLGAQVDALQAKVKSMGLSKEEKTIFTSYLDEVDLGRIEFSKSSQEPNVFKRIDMLKDIDKSLKDIDNLLSSGNKNKIMAGAMNMAAKIMTCSVDSKKESSSMLKLVGNMEKNLTKSMEQASSLDKALMKTCIDDLKGDIDLYLNDPSLSSIDQHVESYGEFALQVLEGGNSPLETGFCQNQILDICDKYMESELSEMPSAVHAAFEEKLLLALNDTAQMQPLIDKKSTFSEMTNDVAKQVYTTHFADRSVNEILNTPVFSEDAQLFVDTVKQATDVMADIIQTLPTCNTTEQGDKISFLKGTAQNLMSNVLKFSNELDCATPASRKMFAACVKSMTEDIEKKLDKKNFANLAKLPENYTKFVSDYFLSPNAVSSTEYVRNSIDEFCDEALSFSPVAVPDKCYKEALGDFLKGHFRTGVDAGQSLNTLMKSFTDQWLNKGVHMAESSNYRKHTAYENLEDALHIDSVFLYGVKNESALKMCLNKIPEMRKIQSVGPLKPETVWKAVLNEDLPTDHGAQATLGQKIYENSDLYKLSFTEQGKAAHAAWLQNDMSLESAVALAKEQRPISMNDFVRPLSFTPRAAPLSVQGDIDKWKSDISKISDAVGGQSPTYSFEQRHNVFESIALPSLKEREGKLDELANKLSNELEKLYKVNDKQARVVRGFINEGGKIVNELSILTGMKVGASTPIDMTLSKGVKGLELKFTVLPVLNESETKQFGGSFSYLIDREGVSTMTDLNLATTDYNKK